MTPIAIRYPVRPRKRSLASATVVDLFGLTDGDDDIVVADQVELDLRPTDLVLFVGPSGSGKSSLLRAAGQQLHALDVQALELPDESVIDLLTGPVEERLALLSSCGLAEPKLTLRSPGELSDGQRARLRIALGFQRDLPCVMIDEFAALLDRPTARVLAYNLRRLVAARNIGALVATTHEDIEDELNPDVVVRCHGDGHVEVTRRDVTKKVPASSASFGSRRAPAPIGRTSLGGITAAMTSASSKRSSCCGKVPNRSASASSQRQSHLSDCATGSSG